ncbi:hypothetical protein PYK79_28410 [Streptomyces sp. ID05-04B]|uniref:hypothetical protein n=1 Tax=unclassified Streptomyces TaxID=2593676 RepID=UPI000D1A858F|nr:MULTISPECIES: hypothetical protein [unclassified Streptomyces]AVV43844.1 hypothetical protein C6376_22685 [Streptomyces sp. P3]MDX5566431.1 hypothetical protein [Streptomyces sp. ID05-04B]
MPRSTTTTATLLAAMAFSALSGCVTVQHPTAPGPAATPSRPPLPGPDGRAGTQVVQAPAREALEMAGQPREPEPTVPSAERPRTSAGGPEHGSRAHPHTRPDRPEHRRRARPRVEIPDVAAEVRRSTDVCALGEKYGGWREGSPEAVICGQTYRR